MSQSEMSQRDAFLSELYERGKIDRDVVLISADMGAPALDLIRRNLPGQFYNAGISEQNAILVASGLALEGKKAFTFAIASFITVNCLEKIRVQMSIMKLPVQIIGVGGGFSYADSGPTHHGIEDVAVMRAFPNIEILNISSSLNAEAAAKYVLEHPKTPRYIRLDREVLPHVPGESEMNFTTGFRYIRKTRSLKALLATGNLVAKIPEIMKSNKELNIIEVARLDKVHESLRKELQQFTHVICLEEHFKNGGLGTLIAETVVDWNLNCAVKRMALSMDSGYSYKYGGREVLRNDLGLNIAEFFEEVMA
ncbi:transketolase family protein [Bdellovibrio sp. HCB185ZH]|uniref:transketolase family protein n=1 Tax=Bdellovibrio sp. HCB185ZH TaxID=3394235 RepID=UPI0039A478F5